MGRAFMSRRGAARGEMTGDFLHLNSDTLFSPPVLQTLLSSPTAPVTLAIDQKERYDDDDMKVSLAGTRLVDVGKTLAADTVNGESIGILLFREDGPRLYVEALERAMLDEAALKQWYLTVVAALAGRIDVQTSNIQGHDWCEIDFPHDLGIARKMIARWRISEDQALLSARSS